MIRYDKDGQVSFGKFDYVIQAIIVVSLITFSIETLPNLDSSVKETLKYVEVIIVIFFTIEYLVRVFKSRNRKGYVFSFFGIIDVVAILPFYLSLGVDLRSARAFRLLRLFSLLKLVRYSDAIKRYHRAFLIAKEELILFGTTAIIIIFIASVGIYHFENPLQPEQFSSVFHSLWWAICTLTTVGYGDIYPITIGGKVFTFIVLMMGLGFVAVPTGLFASALSAARNEEKESLEQSANVLD